MTEHNELHRLLASAPRRGLTRREMLRRLGAGAGAFSAGAVLAACGIGGQSAQNNGTDEEENTLSTTQKNGELNFANWPFYIDRAGKRRPTLEDFEKATDITVNYQEIIEDNESFFGTIREPLAQGQTIEWDLIVVTDWLIEKMARLGYLETLDHSLLPNFEDHAADIYKNPPYDPNNAHSVPWQSGITGIGYNPKLTGRDITSLEDLFSADFKGQVGMMKEMRDTMSLALLSIGVDPLEATTEDAEAAAQRLEEQRDAGIVRQYYGNDYLDALAREDVALTMAWSGDIFQLQFDKPEVQFVVPDEGGILWVDNMAIPEGAQNPIDAHEFMNFVYDPEIAAQITGWVNYICPVPEAKQLLIEQSKKEGNYYRKVAESPLVFPTPEMEARLHKYPSLDAEEEETYNDLFGQVIQG